MAKSALITGISGFAGSYLASELLSKDYRVSGTYLTEDSLSNLSDIKDKLVLSKADLTDKKSVFDLFEKEKPEFVFHLAALASAADSFSDPWKTIGNNVDVQITVLEAIRNAKINPRILIVSSADVYGMVKPSDLPINEDTAFIPTSPYSVSKITQDFLALQYGISYDLDIVRVRPFNHIGPRQSPHFVVAAFAKKIAEIEKSKEERDLKVGNLESRRDFTDVRDTVVAYRLALEKGDKGDVYNIGFGVSHAISEILNILLSFSSKKINVKEDPELIRPADVSELLCDPAKIKSKTGWQTTIPIEQTLKDTLDYWRSIV